MWKRKPTTSFLNSYLLRSWYNSCLVTTIHMLIYRFPLNSNSVFLRYAFPVPYYMPTCDNSLKLYESTRAHKLLHFKKIYSARDYDCLIGCFYALEKLSWMKLPENCSIHASFKKRSSFLLKTQFQLDCHWHFSSVVVNFVFLGQNAQIES